jgi:hypothetical protein
MDDRRRRLNTSDVLHLVQIAVLLISVGVAYEKLDLAVQQSSRTADKIERIEHYLSSKDPEYWRRSKDE